MRIVELAERLLKEYALCDGCLGRQFALLISGTSNSERGRALKLVLTAKAHKMVLDGNEEGEQLLEKLATNGFFKLALQTLEKQGVPLEERAVECHLCRGKFEGIGALTDEIAQKLKKLHFNTFLVGIKISPTIVDKEDEVKSKLGISWGEEIRNEFSREIGKAISKKTEKRVDHRNPEVFIFVDPFKDSFQIQMNPVYLVGWYRKLVTGIQQRAWICKTCNGLGCPECKGLGGTSGNSIEEIISKPILDDLSGEKIMFKPVGSEDKDSRVLGEGRPFITEVRGIKQTSFDLEHLKELINEHGSGRIEVTRLVRASAETAQKITTRTRTTISYKAIVKLEDEITDEKLEMLEKAFSKVMITQYVHDGKFRLKKRRQKYIYKTTTRRLAPDQIELTIKCQGGIRMRDLISGIESKTEPNLTNIIDTRVSEIQLDVMSVQLEGLGEEIQRI